MLVISISGPSASGKTTALSKVGAAFTVFPERYMELNRHGFDNKLIASKWGYIADWFDRILEAHSQKIEDLIVTDRSPLDTVAYVSQHRDALERIVRHTFQEIEAAYGISFRHVLVTAQFEELDRRVRNRLELEPERRLYHEMEADYARQAYDFFDLSEWDRRIDTSDYSPERVVGDLFAAIEELAGRLR